MAPWFDELASDLAEEHLSRRQALARVVAAAGASLIAGVRPAPASATIFRICPPHEHSCGFKGLCCKRNHRCCQGSHGVDSCCHQGQHCCDGRCCAAGTECCPNPFTGGASCCTHHEVCRLGHCCRPGEVCGETCCPAPSKCCGSKKHGHCCAHSDKCCGDKCVDVRNDPKNCGACGNHCPPGETCQAGSCVQQGCGNPPIYCTPQQRCCIYTFNGQTSAVCYDPSIDVCCPGWGACPTTYTCCSAGCCQTSGQFCCPTKDSAGRGLCGNKSTGFGC